MDLVARQIYGIKKTVGNTLLNGLIAYYPLDANSNDLKNAYNGTETNISHVSSVIGNGASFNGSSSYISIPDNNDFSFTNGTNDLPFTVSFNLKINNTSGYKDIISKYTAGNYEWEIRIDGINLEVALYNQTASAYLYSTTTGGVFVAGNQYKVTITYTGSGVGTGIEIYVNNIVTGGSKQTVGAYTKMTNTTSPVLFGKSATNGFWLNGILDDVVFWNRVLTSTERTNNYNRTTNLL
jgi:hypothetical protein